MMEDYIYYYPDGTEIGSREEFIKFYSRMYYYVDHNFALEAEMEKLLKREPKNDLNYDDIENILLWKTGGSLNDNKSAIITRYKTIEIEAACNAYDAWKKNCREKAYSDKDAFIDLIHQLKDPVVTGIGPVIAITIMCYDSCGEYPIYDKFVNIAVQFILDKCKFPKTQKNKTLNTKAEKAYDQYQDFRTNMMKIFEGCYDNTDRDIDRALWVYGHMFSKNKTNDKNEKEFDIFKKWRQPPE